MHLTPTAGTCCTDHPLLWELPYNPNSETDGFCYWDLEIEHPCVGESAYSSTVKAGSTLKMTAVLEVDMFGDVYLTVSLVEIFGVVGDTGFPRNWGVRWQLGALWNIAFPNPAQNCCTELNAVSVPFDNVGAGVTAPLCLDGYGDSSDPAGDAVVTGAGSC